MEPRDKHFERAAQQIHRYIDKMIEEVRARPVPERIVQPPPPSWWERWCGFFRRAHT